MQEKIDSISSEGSDFCDEFRSTVRNITARSLRRLHLPRHRSRQHYSAVALLPDEGHLEPKASPELPRLDMNVTADVRFAFPQGHSLEARPISGTASSMRLSWHQDPAAVPASSKGAVSLASKRPVEQAPGHACHGPKTVKLQLSCCFTTARPVVAAWRAGLCHIPICFCHVGRSPLRAVRRHPVGKSSSELSLGYRAAEEQCAKICSWPRWSFAEMCLWLHGARRSTFLSVCCQVKHICLHTGSSEEATTSPGEAEQHTS